MPETKCQHSPMLIRGAYLWCPGCKGFYSDKTHSCPKCPPMAFERRHGAHWGCSRCNEVFGESTAASA